MTPERLKRLQGELSVAVERLQAMEHTARIIRAKRDAARSGTREKFLHARHYANICENMQVLRRRIACIRQRLAIASREPSAKVA